MKCYSIVSTINTDAQSTYRCLTAQALAAGAGAGAGAAGAAAAAAAAAATTYLDAMV